MSISFRDLESEERTIQVEFHGKTVEVTYRPNVFTPAFREDLRGAGDEAMFVMLCKLVKSWDVLDEDEKRVAPSVAFCKKLPWAFLNAVDTAISEDMKPKDGEKKD